MKKTLFTLIFLVQVIFAIGQETKPTGLKLIQSPSFHYNPVDSAVWMYKNSSYLWNRINYQHWSIKTDSILNPVKLTARDKLNLRDSPSINWTLASLNDSTKEMSANVGDIDVALGVHSLPAYTDNNNGSITIAEGVYVFPVNAAGDGPYRKDTIAGATFTLTDNATNYIVGNLNNGSPIIENITNVALINNRSIFPVYTIYRVGNKLSIIDWDNPAVALSNKLMERFVKTERFAIEPNSLMIDEAPTRLITLTAGYVWTGPARLILTPFISSTDALYHYYHVAGVWTKQTVTTYNNSQYDNGTALQTLNPNKYAVNWIWRDVATNRSECYMVLGGDNYTLDEARASQIPSDLPQEIATNSIFVGRIIVKQAATVATEISSAFEKVFTGGPSGGSYNALPKAKYVPIWNATADSLLPSPIRVLTDSTVTIPKLKVTTTGFGAGKILQSDAAGLLSYVVPNAGTVTSITAGLGLSGGTITTAGTVALDTSASVVLSRQRAANTYQTKTSIINNSTKTNTSSSQTGSTSPQTATTKTYTPKGSKALILFSCRLFNSTGTPVNVYFKTSINGGTPATIIAHEYISSTQISVKGYDLVNVNQNSSNTIGIVWTSDTNHSISERSLIIIDLP